MSQDISRLRSNNIYRLRSYRGYSQKQFATLMGVDAKTISDYERGESFPSLPIAMTMEHILGTRLSEIYPDLHKETGQLAVSREDFLPARFSRHIRGRVFGGKN